MQPVEKDEATNPKIRLYNEIVRHAYDYDTTPISRTGVFPSQSCRNSSAAVS